MTPAASKPDFTGEWILDRPASNLSPAASPIESGLIRIDHRDPDFRFQMRFVAGGAPIEHGGEGRTDGKEVAAEGGAGILYWDGDALIVRYTANTPAGPFSVSFRYEFLDGTRRLRATEELRGCGQDQDNVWMFDRR
jgi:hypothetical protein